MLLWSAHPGGTPCWPLCLLSSSVVLLTAGNTVSSFSSSLSSSPSSVFLSSSSDSLLRSAMPVWRSEHVLISPDVYKRMPVTLSFRDDSNSFGNIMDTEEENGGGGEGPPSPSPSDLQITRDNIKTQPNNSGFRLPSTLRPIHYVVRVQPFINGNYSILGSVQIDIEVLKPTSNITLHVNEMNIHTQNIQLEAAEGDEEGGSVPRITHFVANKDVDFFSAHLDEELQPGRRVRYTIPYEGSLRHYLSGFYGLQYKDKNGTMKHMVSSLHQPIDARMAFPCFDEPGLKATFELHVAREINMTAVSNMPLETTTPIENQEGWVWDRFQTTPPMSTYLLMLVVSSLSHINITAHRQDLSIRVWARREMLHKVTYLQQVVPRVLDYMESYTNFSYPLPKLDIFSIPSSEGAAFEGWGIICIYHEGLMLYDPVENDVMNLREAISLQTHELVHQWFGNVVTPRWWSDEWLSEGVTSYITYLVLQETAMIDQDLLEDEGFTHAKVFHEDDKAGASPVHNKQLDIYNPYTYFNFITYYKGWAILHMMSHVLSHHALRKGMITFLHEHQYGSVEQDDLSRHLTKAAHETRTLPQGLTVKTILDTWTLQVGYPLVTVTRSPSGTSATAYQENYLWSQDDRLPGDHFSTWWVPLTFTSQDSPDFNDTHVKAWLKDTETQTSLQYLPGKDRWIIFNVQQTGYYRVNYDDHNWNLLIKQLLTDHRLIHVNNRAQMVDDVLNLASTGKVSYKTALSLLEYMKNETESKPIGALQHNLEYIKRKLQNTPAYEGFKKYMWALLVPIWKMLGLGNNSELQAIQHEHAHAVKWACNLNLPSCVHLASSLYAQWMLTPNNIKVVPKDLWATVYCTAIANGGEAEWDFAWQQYFLSKNKQHKKQLLHALTCSRNTWTEMEILDMAFTAKVKLRAQDSVHLFNSVASRPGGEQLAWDFLMRRWSAVASLYKDNGEAAEHLVLAAAETFVSQQDMDKVRVFRDSHKDEPRIVAVSEVALDIVAKNIAWMERNYDVICKWLDTRGFSTKLRTL